MDLVGNSIFYAMSYAVLALLLKRKEPAATQSVTLSLFEREYVRTGVFGRRFSEALRGAFALRKGRGREERVVVRRIDVEDLLPVAEEFVTRSDDVISRD